MIPYVLYLLSQLFPGRQSVVKLLETLLEWLISLPLDKIPYEAILDLANNKMRVRLAVSTLLLHQKELRFEKYKPK